MVIVPASNGWSWLQRGLALFAKSPLAWLLVSMTYWLVLGAVARVPLFGLVLASLATPALAMSLITMCRELARGHPLEFALLASGFRRNLASLITLGGLYLAVTVLIFAATQVIDGGTLMRWMLAGTPPAGSPADDGALRWAFLLALFVWLPVQLAFWFAPILIAWHGMSAAKSLFYSFVASWRNWRALLLYGVVVGAALGAFAILLLQVHHLKSGPQIIPTIVFFALVLAVPVYYASVYASYRDVFPEEIPEPPAGQGGPA
jgi:hypothetical protein